MAEILQWRGDAIESRHPFSAVWTAPGVTRLIGRDLVSTWRSAAKPLQLACSLELLGDPAVSEEELAIGAASHSAEPQHVALVDALLSRFGLARDQLRCGAHPPVHEQSAWQVLRDGGTFVDVHNNCSGKHTFMLAAALHNGWDPDYRPANHPLQQHIRARIEAWCGVSGGHAIDGCGVPTLCMPISAFARAWSCIATQMHKQPASRLGRIGWAMARKPGLTSGTGRLDAAMVAASPAPIAVKIGAMGLFCIAIPDLRAGVAVKVHSGDRAALAMAVVAVLQRWLPGGLLQPQQWPWATVHNVVGLAVGRREVVID